MRFNPPPNWPPAPAGWVPDDGWQPDPAWGPPPPGWPLWVPTDAADGGGAVVDYPAGPVPPPGPAPKSRRPLWLGIAALAVVVLVAGALLVVRARDAVPAGPSDKPDITALSTALLVDRAQFPAIGDDDRWTDWQEDDPDAFGPPEDFTVEPPDCADLPDAPRSTTGSVGVQRSGFSIDHLLSYAVQVSTGTERVPLARLVDACRTFHISHPAQGDSAAMAATVQPVAVDGLPSWALAYTVALDGAEAADAGRDGMAMQILAGYYRGLLVQAIASDNVADPAELEEFRGDTAATLLTLFTAQVDNLEAAP